MCAQKTSFGVSRWERPIFCRKAAIHPTSSVGSTYGTGGKGMKHAWGISRKFPGLVPPVGRRPYPMVQRVCIPFGLFAFDRCGVLGDVGWKGGSRVEANRRARQRPQRWEDS